jgi:hypothetical protein
MNYLSSGDWNLQARRNKLHQVVYKHFQTFLENIPNNKEFVLTAKCNSDRFTMEFSIQIDDREVKKKIPLP